MPHSNPWTESKISRPHRVVDNSSNLQVYFSPDIQSGLCVPCVLICTSWPSGLSSVFVLLCFLNFFSCHFVGTLLFARLDFVSNLSLCLHSGLHHFVIMTGRWVWWRWSYRREGCQASDRSSGLSFNIFKHHTTGYFSVHKSRGLIFGFSLLQHGRKWKKEWRTDRQTGCSVLIELTITQSGWMGRLDWLKHTFGICLKPRRSWNWKNKTEKKHANEKNACWDSFSASNNNTL